MKQMSSVLCVVPLATSCDSWQAMLLSILASGSRLNNLPNRPTLCLLVPEGLLDLQKNNFSIVFDN